jgi:multiple antibiotic resistance protein
VRRWRGPGAAVLHESHNFISQFILLWVVIEPVGALTVFLGLTAGMTQGERRATAVMAIIVAAVVILFFIVAGQVLLEALDVDLVSFQIAGGLVLFVFGLTMVLGKVGDPHVNEGVAPQRPSEVAVFPIGMPTIAGPGTLLAVVLLTDNHRFSVMEQAETAGIAGLVLAITLAMLLAAEPIYRVIGRAGANVITRVAGLILTAIAVNNVLRAVTVYFHLDVPPAIGG